MSQGDVRAERGVARRSTVISDPQHITIAGVASDKCRSRTVGVFERAEDVHEMAMELGEHWSPLDRYPHRTFSPASPCHREVQRSNAGKHRGHAFECDVEVRSVNELLRQGDVRQHVLAKAQTL